MKSRGWQGDPPADDAEARERIIEAAMRCIDRYGPGKTGLSDVATELGVTRQTVYRLFPSTEDLLLTVAAAAADTFVDRMVDRVRDLADPAEMLVECLAFTLERLPAERYLSMLFAPARRASFTSKITSSTGFDLTSALLSRLPVDWPALGIAQRQRDELAEIYLRTLQSFTIDPGPPRSGSQLRAFLRNWLAPAVRNHSRDLTPTELPCLMACSTQRSGKASA
jgi:AcrR family transcriptional regulator